MSTDKNIKLPDDVLALLKEQAQNEGVSVDEAATEAIRIGLEEGRWRRLLAAGRRYGRESGYTEEDVDDVVATDRTTIGCWSVLSTLIRKSS